MAFARHVVLVSDAAKRPLSRTKRTWTAICLADETQSPEGSKRSEEAAKLLDGGSAAWLTGLARYYVASATSLPSRQRPYKFDCVRHCRESLIALCTSEFSGAELKSQ